MEEVRLEVKNEIKELILKFVKLENGISNVRVVMKIMNTLGPVMFTSDEFHAAYEELLEDEEILTLEFSAPDLPLSRSKTLLFSKGTIFSNLGDLADEQKERIAFN